jgi:benzoate membrane transport protein
LYVITHSAIFLKHVRYNARSIPSVTCLVVSHKPREFVIVPFPLRLSHVSAGFVAVLVGFTSSVAIIFQAAEVAGASQAQINSWLLALGVGMAVTSIGLSWRYKTPVLTAWSTPGAALLATSLIDMSLAEAVGVFLFSALLVTLSGVTGWFERVMDRIPQALASALLAGVLLRFGLAVFVSLEAELGVVLGMFVAYLIGKRLWSRYAIPLVLGTGTLLAWQQGLLTLERVPLAIAVPQFIVPEFSWSSLIGVGIPLFVVTMTSQNLPGIAAMRASGYSTPVSPLITWTGIATLLLAPFGGYAFNLAAITAAICMGPDADNEPQRRYLAAICAGIFYFTAGIFGTTVVALLAAFPKTVVLALAGLALFATIGNSLATALHDPRQREPALITFLVAASGINLFGISAAFWGLLAGAMAAGLARAPR